jgi:hypothetical protein
MGEELSTEEQEAMCYAIGCHQIGVPVANRLALDTWKLVKARTDYVNDGMYVKRFVKVYNMLTGKLD